MSFSSKIQTSVADVQTQIRAIHQSLYPELAGDLGDKQCYVYTTLAGFCAFAGSKELDSFSPEILKFARDVVQPVVHDCFQEIEKYHNKLADRNLKSAIQDKLSKIHSYPLNVYSLEFKPLSELHNVTFLEFANQKDNELLMKLYNIMKNKQ